MLIEYYWAADTENAMDGPGENFLSSPEMPLGRQITELIPGVIRILTIQTVVPQEHT